MEKEEVKESIVSIINKKSINTAEELAEIYHHYKTGKNFYMPVTLPEKSKSARDNEKFWNFMKQEILKYNKQRTTLIPPTEIAFMQKYIPNLEEIIPKAFSKPLPDGSIQIGLEELLKIGDEIMKAKNVSMTKELNTRRKNFYKKLSKETVQLLKYNNYDSLTINNVLDAIIDFEMPVLVFKEFKKRKKTSFVTAKEPTKLIDDSYRKQLKITRSILSDDFPAPESIKQFFKDRQLSLEKLLKRNTAEIDTLKEYELLMLQRPGAWCDPLNWKANYIVYTALLRTKRPEGALKLNIFLDALKMSIYKYLSKPKKKTLAKQLTANIIKECYGLSKLTYRNIDNVVPHNTQPFFSHSGRLSKKAS